MHGDTLKLDLPDIFMPLFKPFIQAGHIGRSDFSSSFVYLTEINDLMVTGCGAPATHTACSFSGRSFSSLFPAFGVSEGYQDDLIKDSYGIMLTSQKLGSLGFASSDLASLIFLNASSFSLSTARCRSS